MFEFPNPEAPAETLDDLTEKYLSDEAIEEVAAMMVREHGQGAPRDFEAAANAHGVVCAYMHERKREHAGEAAPGSARHMLNLMLQQEERALQYLIDDMEDEDVIEFARRQVEDARRAAELIPEV
jgi:hypothetical protein